MQGFDVVITGFRLNARESPARVLERVLGLAADDARAKAKKFPFVALTAVSMDRAEALSATLIEAGARVELVEVRAPHGERSPSIVQAPIDPLPSSAWEDPEPFVPPRTSSPAMRAMSQAASPPVELAASPVAPQSGAPGRSVSAEHQVPGPPRVMPSGMSIERALALAQLRPSKGPTPSQPPGGSSRPPAPQSGSRAPAAQAVSGSWTPAGNQQAQRARPSQAPRPAAPASRRPAAPASVRPVESTSARPVAPASVTPSASSSARPAALVNDSAMPSSARPAPGGAPDPISSSSLTPGSYALGDLEIGGPAPVQRAAEAALALPASAQSFEADESDLARGSFELDLSGSSANWQGQHPAAAAGGATAGASSGSATGTARDEDEDEDAATMVLELDETAFAQRTARVDKAPKNVVELWLMSAPKATDAAVSLLVEILGMSKELAQRAVHMTPTVVGPHVPEATFEGLLAALRQGGLDVRVRRQDGSEKGEGAKENRKQASRTSGAQPTAHARAQANPASGSQTLPAKSGNHPTLERLSPSGEHALAQPGMEVVFARANTGIVPPAPHRAVPRAARGNRTKVLVGVPLFGLFLLGVALALPEPPPAQRAARGARRAHAVAAVANGLLPGQLTIAQLNQPLAPVHLTLTPAEAAPSTARAAPSKEAAHSLLIDSQEQAGAVIIHFEGHFADPDGVSWLTQGAHPTLLANREIAVEPDVKDGEPSVIEWPDGKRVEIVALRLMVQHSAPTPTVSTDKLVAYEAKAEVVIVLLSGEALHAEFKGPLEVLR